MPALRRFLLRLRDFLRPGRAEADLAREMASHLDLLEAFAYYQGARWAYRWRTDKDTPAAWRGEHTTCPNFSLV